MRRNIGGSSTGSLQSQTLHDTALQFRGHDMRLTRLLAGLALAATAVTTAQAQDYPTRPIKMVIAFPAGGPTDFVGRLVAEKLKGEHGQAVIIEKKHGDNEENGADYEE